ASVVAEVADGDPGGAGDLAAQGDGESVPELAGVRLPQHVANVVVALGVDGLAEQRVSVVVVPAATARHFPAAAGSPVVHRPERGSGQCDEQPGLVGHGDGDVLGAAGQPGAQQVEGVGRVAVRAGGADAFSAVAARGEDVPGALGQARAGGRVDELPVTGQPDRVRA